MKTMTPVRQMKNALLFLLLFLLPTATFGQAGNIQKNFRTNVEPQMLLKNSEDGPLPEWEQLYIPEEDTTQYFMNVFRGYAVDRQKNIYLLAATVQAQSGENIMLVKYDTDGNVLWQRIFDGELSGDDRAGRIFLTGNGNIQVIGTTARETGNQDFIRLIYSPEGELLSKKYYDGVSEDNLYSAMMDDAGNLYLIGTFVQNLVENIQMLKIDATGQLVWRTETALRTKESLRAVRRGQRGDFYFFIGEKADNQLLPTLLKISASGQVAWRKPFPITIGLNIWAPIFFFLDRQDEPGIVAEVSEEDSLYQKEKPVLIAKSDSSGNFLWQKIYYKSGQEIRKVSQVKQDQQDNIYLALQMYSSVTGYLIRIVKFSTGGDLIWKSSISGNETYLFLTVDSLSQKWTLWGYWQSENSLHYKVVRFDSSGIVESQNPGELVGSGDVVPRRMSVNDNEILIFCDYRPNFYQNKLLMLKMDDTGGITWQREAGLTGAIIANPMAFAVSPSERIYVGFHQPGRYGLLRYDSDGRLRWAVTDTLFPYVEQLVLDEQENIYLISHMFKDHKILVKYSSSGEKLFQVVLGSDGEINRYYSFGKNLFVDRSGVVSLVYKGYNSDNQEKLWRVFTISSTGEILDTWDVPEMGSALTNIAGFDFSGRLIVSYVDKEQTKLHVDGYDRSGQRIWRIEKLFPEEYNFVLMGLSPDLLGNEYVVLRGDTKQQTFIHILKISAQGEWVWEYRYENSDEEFPQIKISPRNEVYVVVDSVKYGKLLKLTPTGETDWQKRFAYAKIEVEFDREGNVFLGGRLGGYSRILKITPDGEEVWSYDYHNLKKLKSILHSLQIAPSGSIYLLNYIGTVLWHDQMSVAKLRQTGQPIAENRSGIILGSNYPNPFNQTTVIPYTLLQDGRVRFILYNVLGQKVLERALGQRTAGKYLFLLSPDLIENLASGVYFYQIKSGRQSETRKLLLLR